MRIDAAATRPLAADLCHQLMGIAGHVIKGPFSQNETVG